MYGFDQFNVPKIPDPCCSGRQYDAIACGAAKKPQCHADCTRLIVIKFTVHHPVADDGNRDFEFRTYYKYENPLSKLMEKKVPVVGPALVTNTIPTIEYWDT